MSVKAVSRPMNVDDLGRRVERIAKERGIALTKIAVFQPKSAPKGARDDRFAPTEPRVYAEIDGGMALGRFSMTLDDAQAVPGDGLDAEIGRRLDDAQWEASPKT